MVRGEEDHVPFGTNEEVEELVRKFEAGRLSPSEFNHRAHLVVALRYVRDLSEGETHALVRRKILEFLARNGVDSKVYNETVTLFWLRRVRAFVEVTGRERELSEAANELLQTCGDSRLIRDYFSSTLLSSEAARAGWVEPDLRPLDF